MVKNFIFSKIIFFSFINHILSKIILPIELLPKENYKIAYSQNSICDMIDSEMRNSFYTIFKIGSPLQKVPLIINPKSDLFFINNQNNYSIIPIDSRKYNFSKNFLSKYNYYNSTKSISSKLNWCRESEFFPDVECCSFNDDIFFYENFKKEDKKVNIKFESMNNIEDNITGEIGLNLYDRVGRVYNTFLGILKISELIDSYYWYFDFNSSENQKGKIVIGSLIHEDYPNLFSEDDLFFTNSFTYTGKEFMQMKFTKIYTIDNINEEKIQNEYNTQVELSYDSNVILCDFKYKNYLLKKMHDLFEEKKCFNDIVRNFDDFLNYTFLYCKNENNVLNRLKKIINTIYLYSDDFNYALEITSDDLIKIKGDFILIQIIFNEVNSRWNLGKIFTLKYNFIFNQEKKQIGFYKKNNNKKDKYEPNYFKIIWIIVTIIALCIILILSGYFLGKYWNKVRKKRANELNDDYDYVIDKNENTNGINNVLVDDNKNIN